MVNWAYFALDNLFRSYAIEPTNLFLWERVESVLDSDERFGMLETQGNRWHYKSEPSYLTWGLFSLRTGIRVPNSKL